MPPAARVMDLHMCSMVAPPGAPILPAGEPTVLIGFMPAARMGDLATCPNSPDAIVMGEPTVLVGNKPAARVGDPTSCGGVIAIGCPTVFIGSATQNNALKTDKPFCEECERKRREDEEEAEAEAAEEEQSS